MALSNVGDGVRSGRKRCSKLCDWLQQALPSFSRVTIGAASNPCRVNRNISPNQTLELDFPVGIGPRPTATSLSDGHRAPNAGV